MIFVRPFSVKIIGIIMKHCGTQTIITERLILRRFEEADAEHMFNNWANDADVTKFMRWQPHGDISVTADLLREWVASYEHDDFYDWAIVLKDSNIPIGSIGCMPNNKYNDLVIEVGYCISKAYWRKGFTSEALAAVIEYIFGNTDCIRIEANHDPRNPNSGRVMKKCGMQYEGTLRMRGKNTTGICDECVYSILRSEIGKK